MNARDFILGVIIGAMFVVAISWMSYTERMERMRMAKEAYLTAEAKAKDEKAFYELLREQDKQLELIK